MTNTANRIDPVEPVSSGTEPLLDPADWDEMRALGRLISDEALTHLETVRERPVWESPPQAVREALRAELPREGIGARRAYEKFKELILPYGYGNIHPRFWGWVNGSGTPFTVLAELLARTMNPNVYGSDSGPFYVEHQVLNWLKTLLELPVSHSGVLVSGGSVANWVGLASALYDRAGVDIGTHGLGALEKPMMAYGSTETHLSIDKALRLLGLGDRAMRRLPVQEDFSLDLGTLEAGIARDREAGNQPFCVVANAGSTSTGAFDPIEELVELCKREGLWLHVDGAFGALVAGSPGLRHFTRGMEMADSVAFDLHKWLHMPIDAGCTFVRDPQAHRRPFASSAPYLAPTAGGISSDVDPLANYSLELTRPFRALKVWLGLLEKGADAYVEAIERNVDQAVFLAERVEREPMLQLLAPQILNVVNFRYVVEDASEDELNTLNRALLVAVQESGSAVPSAAFVEGRAGLRVALTNHRTTDSDLDYFVDETLRLASEPGGMPSN